VEAAFAAALDGKAAQMLPVTSPAMLKRSDERQASEWESEWDDLLADLVEMGFQDLDENVWVVKGTKGSMNASVQALVLEERCQNAAA